MSVLSDAQVTGVPAYTPNTTPTQYTRYAAALAVWAVLAVIFTIDQVGTRHWRAITILCAATAILITALAIATVNL
ncbi:MAG: hypothetical protein ABWZ77_05185 [Naasia sp.]